MGKGEEKHGATGEEVMDKTCEDMVNEDVGDLGN